MPEVISLFICGTGESRDNEGNIVVEAFKCTKDNSTSFIVDGVGNSKHVITKNKKLYKYLHGGGKMPVNVDNHWAPIKNLTGGGVFDNVRTALLFLEDHIDIHTHTINLVGWSRGAVTTIMIAHSIFRHFEWRRIRVNIFAMDPVAGGPKGLGWISKQFNPFRGKKGKFEETGIIGDHKKLPPNVVDYVGIVAEAIGSGKGFIFRPVTPRSRGSMFGEIGWREYHFPTDHSGVAKINGPCGEIIASLCAKFLRRHGAGTTGLGRLNTFETLEMYSRVRLNYSKDWASRYTPKNRLRSEKAKPKSFIDTNRGITNVNNDYSQHPFWINQHHVECFIKVLGQPAADEVDDGELSSRTRANIRGRLRRTRDALIETGIWRAEG